MKEAENQVFAFETRSLSLSETANCSETKSNKN